MFLKLPILYESRFWWLAIVLSVVLAARGIAIKMHELEIENSDLKQLGKVQWHKWQRVFVQYFQDFIYNFVGSMAGWVAFYILSCRLFIYVGSYPPPQPGYMLNQPNVHLLGWPDLWLTIIVLLGITAKLPQTMEGFIFSIGKIVEAVIAKLAKS